MRCRVVAKLTLNVQSIKGKYIHCLYSSVRDENTFKSTLNCYSDNKYEDNSEGPMASIM